MDLGKMFRAQFETVEPGAPRATPNETPRVVWVDGSIDDDDMAPRQAPLCPQCDEPMKYRKQPYSIATWVCPNYDSCHEAILADEVLYRPEKEDWADPADTDDWLDSNDPW